MRLESVAYLNDADLPDTPLYRIGCGEPQVIDLSPMVAAIVEGKAEGRSVEMLAAMFHDQLAWAWSEVVDMAARRLGIKKVALSGGVFCNERLNAWLVGQVDAVWIGRVGPP